MKPNKYRLSIIIPYAMEWPLLWATVHNMIEETRHELYMNSEIIVVENGSTGEDLRLVRRLMGARGRNEEVPGPNSEMRWGPPRRFAKKYIEVPHQLHSKPAINLGAWAAEGEYLGFQDSHTLVSRRFFEIGLDWMDEHPEVAILHAPISWTGWNPHTRGYQYKMKLDRHFWGAWRAHKVSDEPYPIAASGNCSMIVRRDAFLNMGGFPSMLRFYGGGEPYIDLLAWMFGYEVYLHPDLHCYHFALTKGRRYQRSPQTFFRNVCLAAYICGGEKYSKPLLDRAIEEHPKEKIWRTMAYKEALKFGRFRRRHVEHNAKHTLDEVVERFERENIYH